MDRARTATSLVPGSAGWWVDWRQRLDRRRPRADGLTIERIVAAAVAIVDADGLDALTVRRIADHFGTGSATLYRHFASREELLELLVDHVIGEVRLPPGGLDGRQKLEWLSGELRRVLMAHANLVPVLATSPLLGPNATRGVESGLAGLAEAGYPAPTAALAYRALLDFVLGTVFFDTSRAACPGPAGNHAAVLAALPDGVFPTLRAHEAALSSVPSDEVFAFGLQALLEGMEHRHLRR
jgi:AcrR family transcriptional regulator